MKIHNNIKQQSEEWFKLRELKMTASNATAIGNCGAGLKTYAAKLVAEYLSESQEERYSNKHMDRGNELEDEAVSIYEMKTGNKVDKVGFIEEDERSGCSPDGLIGEEGGLEVKCLDDTVYVKAVADNKVDSGYMWQIQDCLRITKRKWWDYVVYNPNFKKCMMIIRVYPDMEMFEKLEKGLIKGKQLISDNLKAFA